MDADFIIVGAGSAGCVLAERLSRNTRHQVLILEAGGHDNSLWIDMPLGYGKLFYDRRVNWAYRTKPDPGLNGNEDYWPRGKVVGGSSAINAMVYIRGADADFDDWARATGDDGWGAASMLQTFRDMEDNDAGANEWRGSGGPLPAHCTAAEVHPITTAFLEGCEALSLPRNADFNGAQQEGAGLYQINTRNGRRVSAAKAFLRPALKRGNVRLVTDATVTSLKFDGTRCTGLSFVRHGKIESAHARREVILSAGAVESPKLLQLSGIGAPSHLASLGITVRVGAPVVGQNLQDHVGLNYFFRARFPTLNQELAPFARRMYNGARYLFARSGPLALSVNQAGAFFRTSPERPRPNMQLYLQVLTTLEAKKRSRPLLAPDPYPALALGLSNTHPKSRGSILIESNDPLAPPAIRPNVYQHPDDLEEMLEAVSFIRRLAATPGMAKVIERELRPGEGCDTREAMIADIRARTGTVFHPCGTCAMGTDAATSVLDHKLRVRGTGGLRVVDASAFPRIISGNLNVPVMVLAARAGEIIEADES